MSFRRAALRPIDLANTCLATMQTNTNPPVAPCDVPQVKLADVGAVVLSDACTDGLAGACAERGADTGSVVCSGFGSDGRADAYACPFADSGSDARADPDPAAPARCAFYTGRPIKPELRVWRTIQNYDEFLICDKSSYDR